MLSFEVMTHGGLLELQSFVEYKTSPEYSILEYILKNVGQKEYGSNLGLGFH